MNLVMLQGADSGRVVRLERGVMTMGRGPDRDVVLREPQASRSHAELRRFGDQAWSKARWLIVDVGSTNGTLVDGERLQTHQPRPLLPGVEVAIGQTRWVLREDPDDEALRASLGSAEAGLGRVPGASSTGAVSQSPAWSAAAWLGRFAVAAGGVLLILGALSEWIQVQVQLPLVPIALDRSFGGTDSGQSALFIAVGAVAILLVLFDVLSRRYGFAAGLGQALLGAAIVVAMALQLRRYYEAATQEYLGISLLDILSEYARDYVSLSVKSGVYFLGAGLALVILGGLVRLVVGGLELSGS
jgi:hypothetical protein